MLAILAIALLTLALVVGYVAFLTQRAHPAAWDLFCIIATLAFLGVVVRMVALRVERMVVEEAPPDLDETPPQPASMPARRAPGQNMNADSPPDHRPFAPAAEYQCEERV